MKRVFILLLILTAVPFIAYEQTQIAPQPAYLKDPTIPSFKVFTCPDSVLFTKEDLPKGVPVVIIYFAPDCGHCQYEAKEIVHNMGKLENAFFLWVAFRPMNEITEFGKKYELEKYGNIKLSRDPKYFIPSFFKVEFTPFIAVYDSHGAFKKEFRMGAKPEELIEAIK